MAAIDDFKKNVADAESANYYTKWTTDNKSLANLWYTFRDGILAGTRPPVPDMGKNKYGWSLVDMGVTYLNATTPTPVTPPSPPSSSGFYSWDATKATKLADQTMAQYIASNLWNPGTPQAAFGAENAVVYVPANQPMVNVTWNPGWTSSQTLQVPIPPGTRPGGANDHHLTVVRADGTVYSMEWYQPGPPATCTGLGIVQPGKVNEGSYNATAAGKIGSYDSPNHYSGSNAANLDMSQVIHPDDVKNWNLKTLQFGMHDDAQSSLDTSVFPSPPMIYNDPRIPYGQWARLDPNGSVPNYPSQFLKYLDACLRQKGMVMRDQATALTIYGFDMVNLGGNVAKWAEVGVNLNLNPGWAGYSVGCYIPGIPWNQLQVLAPPPH